MSSDATAVLKQKQPVGKPTSWTRAAAIWAGIGLLLMATMSVIVLWIAGFTHGREFNATSWSFRSFNFIRNPLTGKQVSAIHRSPDFTVPTNIIALTNGGPLAPAASRWDLVEMFKGTNYSSGQAQILLDYLSAFDSHNNYYWETWTTEHPLSAPILWSAVRDCVHLPRYDRLPEIFEAARANPEPKGLESKLKTIMLDIAQDEAALQTKLGNDVAKQRADKLAAAYADKGAASPNPSQAKAGQ